MYSISAENNYAPAFVNVGYCYEKGLGTKADIKKAVEYYEKAAEYGDKYAPKALIPLKFPICQASDKLTFRIVRHE